MSTIRQSMRLFVFILACLSASAAPAAAQVLAQVSSVRGPWTASVMQARTHNPLLPTTAQIEFGRELYQRECEACHGHLGHGDGMQSGAVNTPIPDLSVPKVQSQTDGALFWKISDGRGEMPAARPALSDNERWAVVIYLRTLVPKR